MKRAPLAVVVTKLIASSSAGNPKLLKMDRGRVSSAADDLSLSAAVEAGDSTIFATPYRSCFQIRSRFGRFAANLSAMASPSLVVGTPGFERVQFLARLEADCLPGSDADLGSGTRIAANAGFAGADAEYSETAQLDALAGGQRLLQSFEDSINRSFRLGARKAGTLDDMVDDILLDQRGNLSARFEWVNFALRQ